jgi:hypothetical protein
LLGHLRLGRPHHPAPSPLVVTRPVAIPVAKSQHMKSRRERGPKPDRRRALEVLAGNRDGVPEAIMLAHGFSIELLVELVHSGLATASTDRMIAGRHPIEVTRDGRWPTIAHGQIVPPSR